MSVTALRDELAADTLTAAEARKALAALPKLLGAKEGAQLYAGFRAWVWKTLDQKRRDGELREWADLIQRARVRLGAGTKRDHQFETLAELVAESVAVSARFPMNEILAKRHTREVLSLLREARGTPVTKKELMERLSLGGPNLTRIMNLLGPAGLVEIEKNGRETLYALSRSGAKAANMQADDAGPALTAAKSSRAPTSRPAPKGAKLREWNFELKVIVETIVSVTHEEFDVALDADALQALAPPPEPFPHFDEWFESNISASDNGVAVSQLRNSSMQSLEKILRDPDVIDPCAELLPAPQLYKKLESANGR